MSEKIMTRPPSDEYRENWDRVFGELKETALAYTNRVFDEFEHCELCADLYNTANDIVGNVGPETSTLYAATGEPVVTVSFLYTTETEVKQKWKDFIEAYTITQAIIKPEGRSYLYDGTTTIYWRAKPRIRTDEEQGDRKVWARLLISSYPQQKNSQEDSDVRRKD